MNDYETALNVARGASVTVPEFEAVAEESERERERWREEDRDARTRARRWLLVAVGVWLALPLLAILEEPWHHAFLHSLTALPFAFLLLWAMRMSRDGSLRSAILTRGIAGSNLLLAFFASLWGTYVFSILSVLLAVAMGRSLQLLGERDLDGSNDRDSSFEPVKFRGVLILTLILACADALWLSVVGFSGIIGLFAYGTWSERLLWLPNAGFTVGAALFMIVNIWGLLRLRTWALFGGMFGNVAIGVLALTDKLLTGSYASISLMVTAGIQLLLPLPILAAALGVGGGHWFERVGAVLLRVVVPLMVLATIVSAALRIF